jgi:hypothetical protein
MSRYDQRLAFTPLLPPRMFGGLDSKCLRQSEAVQRLYFHARASPVSDEANGIPVFEWDDPPEGLPKRWDFQWITFGSQQPDKCSLIKDKGSCKDTDGCGWCGDRSACLPGDDDAPLYGEKCDSGWATKSTLASWVIPVSVVCGVLVVGVVIGAIIIYYRRRRLGGLDPRGMLGN